MPEQDVAGRAVSLHARVGVEFDDAPLVCLVARQTLGVPQQVMDNPVGARPHRERPARGRDVGDQADRPESGSQQLRQGRAVQAVRAHVAVTHGRTRRQVPLRQLAVDAADPLRNFDLAPAEELLHPPQDHRVGRQHGHDPRFARRRHVLPGEIVAEIVTLLDQLLVGSEWPEPGAGVVSLHARRRTGPLALAGARHELRIEQFALDQVPLTCEEPDLVRGKRAHRVIDCESFASGWQITRPATPAPAPARPGASSAVRL